MSDQEFRKLTTVTSNVEYDLLKTFLESEGIPVMYKEHGFGGPIRSVYFGNLKTAFYALPKGTRVILRGWIETRDEIGVVVMSELEELFPLPKEKKPSLSNRAPKELQMLS